MGSDRRQTERLGSDSVRQGQTASDRVQKKESGNKDDRAETAKNVKHCLKSGAARGSDRSQTIADPQAAQKQFFL